MENSITILYQLLLLFTVMVAGYYSYKKGWVNDHGSAQISSMVVKIFNPAIIISTSVGSDYHPPARLVIENIILVVIFFASLILLGPVVARLIRVKPKNRLLFQIMFIFVNLGFMGIPLVTSLFGEDETFYLTWYILGFNLVFYTYGLYTFGKISGNGQSFSIKKMFNSGVIACLIAIAYFLFPIDLPEVAVDMLFCLSDLCVPLGMMVTGFALAKTNLKEVFTDVQTYAFIAVKMVVLPIIVALIIGVLKGNLIHTVTGGIMVLMYGMPNASLPIIVCEENGIESEMLSSCFALTTLLSIVTLPIVTSFI